MPIFQAVIWTPRKPSEKSSERRRRAGNFALWQVATVGAFGVAAISCRAAPNPTGPPATGPDFTPPALSYSPSKDTVVDSVGVLQIVVSAHDQSLIDSVVVLAQGAPNTFQPVYPQDTTVLVFWPVTLASLHHQAFTFQVAAGDVLGHDTVTKSVKVTPR